MATIATESFLTSANPSAPASATNSLSMALRLLPSTKDHKAGRSPWPGLSLGQRYLLLVLAANLDPSAPSDLSFTLADLAYTLCRSVAGVRQSLRDLARSGWLALEWHDGSRGSVVLSEAIALYAEFSSAPAPELATRINAALEESRASTRAAATKHSRRLAAEINAGAEIIDLARRIAERANAGQAIGVLLRDLIKRASPPGTHAVPEPPPIIPTPENREEQRYLRGLRNELLQLAYHIDKDKLVPEIEAFIRTGPDRKALESKRHGLHLLSRYQVPAS